MKKILLLALLSFGINATTAILDWTKLEEAIRTVIFRDNSNYLADNSKLKNDAAEWAKEKNLDLVLVNDYGNAFPCLYFSTEADLTQDFIDWLKKKYL